MNRERYNQIIEEVRKACNTEIYRSVKKQEEEMKQKGGWISLCLEPCLMGTEEFVNEIKIKQEFSKKWGLKIEERELSFEERLRLVDYDKEKFVSIDEWVKWYENQSNEFYYGGVNYNKEIALTALDVPTKVLTLTYNNEKVEVYE